jgi:hypothetical protein
MQVEKQEMRLIQQGLPRVMCLREFVFRQPLADFVVSAFLGSCLPNSKKGSIKWFTSQKSSFALP